MIPEKERTPKRVKAKARPPQECFVYLQMPGSTEIVTCGKFAQLALAGGGVAGVFVYGQRYRTRTDAVAIDPYHLPVSAEEVRTTNLGGVFGALRDASPDAWGRRLIEHHARRTDLTEIDFLLESPEDRAGALSFGRGVSPPAPVRAYNRVVHLSDLMEAARLMEDAPGAHADGERLNAARFLLEQHGTSMGGARAKSVVEADDALWIAKFPQKGDHWNNAVVEAAMLHLADRCGITVPATRIERVGAHSVLLVRRFDRERTEEAGNPYLRYRMASALTALDADDAVTNRGRWSYVLFADELRRWSGRSEADRKELFRRMVFNALVSNNDDHPRNHALIAPRSTWFLSPAYDITPNPQMGRHDRDLAMVCGTSGRQARRANLLSEVGRFGLRPLEAAAIMDEMIGIIQAKWMTDILERGGTVTDVEAVRTAFLDEGFEYAT